MNIKNLLIIILVAFASYSYNSDKPLLERTKEHYETSGEKSETESIVKVVKSGDIEKFAKLVENDDPIDQEEVIEIIYHVIYSGMDNKQKEEVVKLLFQYQPDLMQKALRYRDDNLKTFLMMAIAKDNIELCKLFINKSSDLNYRDRFKKTALMIALECDQLEIANLLLSKNAKTKIKDDGNRTALEIAQERNHFEIAKRISEIMKREVDDSQCNLN